MRDTLFADLRVFTCCSQYISTCTAVSVIQARLAVSWAFGAFSRIIDKGIPISIDNACLSRTYRAVIVITWFVTDVGRHIRKVRLFQTEGIYKSFKKSVIHGNPNSA